MATVTLQFQAPDTEDLSELRVYEAAAPTGPFVQIDSTTEIFAGEGYIDSFTTDAADTADDWFSITWVAADVESPLSPPVRGVDPGLVGEIAQRVMQRDPSLDYAVVLQEAESVVEQFFGKDPYSVDLSVDAPAARIYRTKNGLTYWTLAQTILAGFAMSSSVQSATLGLVSFRSESGQTKGGDVQELLDLAWKQLGIGGSVVLDMRRICQRYGGKNWRSIQGRIDGEIMYQPWVPRTIEAPRSARRLGTFNV
jgi:hypothetical protein